MKPIRKYEIENTKPNNKNNSININTEIIDKGISNSITYPNVKTDTPDYTSILIEELPKQSELITEESVYKENNFIPEQIDKSQIIPSGEIKIIKNGVYSVYKYAQANVDINIEGEPYQGDYIIIPSAKEDIILETTNKIAEDDINEEL